ncbi:multiple sugar transport system substrate-binding protein [Bosea sp. OK403]|uniref:ABC transporter substrate-binding protein n=1 Tax=Bosea sp. OK403 TaxID=1855286 RepID=UPI0008E86B8A|nr:extracellular solute-binding protein [Bosea sp. OK403]SFI48936.1 multiple sugar transport system substrate-binding protein [Bosea sp. OK403]
MTHFSRRETLKLGGAAMLASGGLIGGARAAIPVADVAAPDFKLEKGATLRVLRPAKFVPADETLFNENTKAFTAKTGIPVRVDYQAWEDLRPQTAVSANTGVGADVVIGWADDPHLYSDKLLELSDVAEYLGKKYGGWYPLSERIGKKFGTNNWIAIPLGGSGGPAVYRESWVKEAGFDGIPKELDGFLKLCQQLQKNKHPAGFALGHAVGDANSYAHWLLWSHGGSVVDEGGKVTMNSKETVAALKYAKALYETFIPGTQSWQDPSNNKAMLAGEIGLTQNGVSVYYAFKNSQDPKIAALAADVTHAPMPIGPVGRGTETALVVNSMVFKYTKFPNAAKAYLTFLMEAEQYDKWLTGSAGYWAHPLAAYEKSAVWASDPKIAAYRDTMKNSLWYGYKGPIGDASAAVVADYVTVDMFASVCSGAETPESAAAEGARRAARYYKKG